MKDLEKGFDLYLLNEEVKSRKEDNIINNIHNTLYM